MTKMERCRVAMEYHEKGFNCAQSVLEAYRDMVGLTREQCLGVATGLGGGFRTGGICGAASGAVLVLGLLYPHATENDPERKAYTAKLTKELLRRFTEQFNGLLTAVNCCRTRPCLSEKKLRRWEAKSTATI